MGVGDARGEWPQWVDVPTSAGGRRVRWRVVDNTQANDRLACKYTGRTAANRVLIGNGGVTEFALVGGPLCFSKSGSTDSHCGVATVLKMKVFLLIGCSKVTFTRSAEI
eukprot:COSAG01_NODE_29006_length_647_cov_2.624088_1_plen_109_part_00